MYNHGLNNGKQYSETFYLSGDQHNDAIFVIYGHFRYRQ